MLLGSLLAIASVGVYLATKGKSKPKPTGSTQTHTPPTGATLPPSVIEKPIPETVNTFLGTHKPFEGIEGVGSEVTRNVQNIGSRTRADFSTVINGEKVVESVIFNEQGKAVSKFVQTTSNEGSKVTRQAFKLNEKGESQLIQTSTRNVNEYNTAKINGKDQTIKPQIYEKKAITNHDVTSDYLLKSMDENGDFINGTKLPSLNFNKIKDKETKRLIMSTKEKYTITPKRELNPWSSQMKIYGYNKDGNIGGIIVKNPKEKCFATDDITQFIPYKDNVAQTAQTIKNWTPYIGNTKPDSITQADFDLFNFYRESKKPIT